MLGAIIGDIVGSRWEFNPTNDYNFELFSDKNSFTDDTVCTIGVADALLHEDDDYGKYIHKWCRKYPNPMGGYGGRFAKWVASDNPQPYNSYGNGSAMRVSPIGWWFGHPHDIYEHGYKSAACTHNHEEGIIGAQAVAFAIEGCRDMKDGWPKEKEITEEDILWGAIDHGVGLYEQFPQNFKVDLSKCANKFDETCQGTVPVAFQIILKSKSFEDAIRQAVSLGADADTLGAIVGSIAEPLWGIPEWIKEKALTYLPDDMKEVVFAFRERRRRLLKLSKSTQYYKFGEFTVVDNHQKAYDIEKKWVHDLGLTFKNAEKMKAKMAKRCSMNYWQKWSDEYDLPVSLIGYIFDETASDGMFMHECVEPFLVFLHDNYDCRKPQAEKKKAEKEKMRQYQAMMFWKLSLGNPNKVLFNQGSPLPEKTKVATSESWQIQAMPTDTDDVSDCKVSIPLTEEQLQIIKFGHIPEQQEDHWFMYTDDENIHYYRSWTGMCAFDAHYTTDGKEYRVDHLKMNRSLCQWGVNGDEAGIALFRYLLTAETGGDAEAAWQDYLYAWEKLVKKYSKDK